ncbi:hypothetical protein DYBT9275_01162 [Dyadobacter sp. CECT 9275]|uniref:Uncharacterized protein n=1 Tax=Dyadobacter helix TaxID=2822344 RepID=A0A916J8U3_9BACT|nr:hypothetical protein [Dyadobacter sp. CECT 9275]CAG4993396.1 hypothetical protein DYBT9275_01162 [Dyadobacter sp. CECT 9275]
MKSLILLFSLLFTISQVVSAQKLKAGRLKSDAQTFDVSKVRDHFVVGNITNKVVDKNRKLPERLAKGGYEQYLSFGSEDIFKINSLVSAEYSKASRDLPTENPLITYYVSENGEILAMEFLISSSSSLTIDDLRIIESAIKGKFKFNTDQKMLAGAGYVGWTSRLSLTQILDNPK